MQNLVDKNKLLLAFLIAITSDILDIAFPLLMIPPFSWLLDALTVFINYRFIGVYAFLGIGDVALSPFGEALPLHIAGVFAYMIFRGKK